MRPVDRTVDEFELSSERAAILDTADRFARNELAPLFARMDAEEWWPEDVMRKIGSAGLIGVAVDPSLGGAGMDFFCQGLVIQAIARHNSSVGLSYATHENLFVNNLYRNGTAAQKELGSGTALRARRRSHHCDAGCVGSACVYDVG